MKIPKQKKIEIHDILVLPKWTHKATKQISKRTVPKAVCLTPVQPSTLKMDITHTPQHPKQKSTRKMSVSATTKGKAKLVTQKKQKLSGTEDDWTCHTCKRQYSEDVSS